MCPLKASDHAFLNSRPYGPRHEVTYAGATSFLRRPYSRNLEEFDVAVTGIPFDTATTNRPGARFGPRAIREASTQLTSDAPYGFTIDPMSTLAIVDYGDCALDYAHPQNMPAQIRAHAAKIIATDTRLLSLGGDHFISYPLLQAHAERYGQLSLLHFDAHTDTWDSDGDDVDHGTMFTHALREGLFDAAHSVQVGIRTTNANTRGIHILDATSVHQCGVDRTAEAIREIIGARSVYLTFDIDCLDPSVAPGTGTPVIGGLSTWQAQAILRKLVGLSIIGADVVEVAPAYDVAEITALAGATLGLDFLALMAATAKG